MPTSINVLLGQYISALRSIYGEHLRKIILYGSYARGDYNEDSDIDIMLLFDITDIELKQYMDQLVDTTYDFNMDNNLDIKPIVKNESQFAKWEKNYPFYANVVREGITLYAA